MGMQGWNAAFAKTNSVVAGERTASSVNAAGSSALQPSTLSALYPAASLR